jgi:hypothetical protein
VYDRAVCNFRNERGVAIPVSSDERHATTQHAHRVRLDIIVKGRKLGYTDSQVMDAIRETAEMHFP